MRCRLAFLASIVTLCLMDVAACAEDPALAASMKSMFASGWRNSATAISSAQPHYAKAQAAAPADARPAYAMALIAIKNSKHPEAHQWLDEALSRNEHHLASRRAKVWVDLLTRQYAAALSGMQAAAKSAAAVENASPVERQALASSMGRMMGYLAAAAPGGISDGEFAAAEQEILVSLPRSVHVAFLEGKSQSIERFEQMKVEVARQQETVIEEQTEQKNLAQKKLDEDKGDLAEAKVALSAEAQKVRDKYTAEETALNKDIAPLAARMTTLDGRARELRDYLLNVDRDIERLIGSAAFERGRDGVREAALLREADRLRFQSRGAREEFLRVDREIGQVRAQGTALEAKLRDAQAWLQGEMRRINGEGSKLVRTEKGLQAAEKKVSSQVTGLNSRMRVTATRVNSLSTYEDFPLDSEKQRLLDSLR